MGIAQKPVDPLPRAQMGTLWHFFISQFEQVCQITVGVGQRWKETGLSALFGLWKFTFSDKWNLNFIQNKMETCHKSSWQALTPSLMGTLWHFFGPKIGATDHPGKRLDPPSIWALSIWIRILHRGFPYETLFHVRRRPCSGNASFFWNTTRVIWRLQANRKAPITPHHSP